MPIGKAYPENPLNLFMGSVKYLITKADIEKKNAELERGLKKKSG